MKEYNYSQRKGGSNRLRLKQWGSLKMKIHCRLQEEGCVVTTGESRCKALAWNMLVGYVSTCYPSLTQLQSGYILTSCQIVQYWNGYLSYCPYVLVIILRPITVTGCFSECFPYLYTFGRPKGVLDSWILPGDFGACFCVSLKYQNCNISLPPSFDFILMRLTHDTMPLLAIRQMDLCPPTFTHQTISAALFIAWRIPSKAKYIA